MNANTSRLRTLALAYAGYDQDTCTTRQVLTIPGTYLVATRTHTPPQRPERTRWHVLSTFDAMHRAAPWYLSPVGSTLTAGAAYMQPAQQSPLPTVLALTSDELFAIEHGTIPQRVIKELPTPPMLPVVTALTAAAFPGDSEGGLEDRVQTFTIAAIENPETLRGFITDPVIASASAQHRLVRAPQLHAAELEEVVRGMAEATGRQGTTL